MKKEGVNQLFNTLENKISVIIPVRNEADNIARCLDSLSNQNYNKANFEVIIIDDHSTDNTSEIVINYFKNSELNSRFYQLENTYTKKEGLKCGIEKSNYNIISSTDADCILPSNWLFNISIQINKKADMILGPVIFKEKPGFLSAFQQLDMLAIQSIEFGMLSYKKPILNNAANLTYLKEKFYVVNGFDQYNTPSGDDVFLLEKFKKHNKNVLGSLKEDFIVLTNQETSFSSFINQRLRWSSKAKYYSNSWLLFISTIVLIQNISLIFIYIGILFVEKYWIILLILLFCKWLIDFILLFLAASFFKRKKVLYYFIPVQVVYPIYLLFVWITSIMITFEWKGRNYNG
ncbi:MAG: hypothetical protein CO118_02960 [Flavobacteriales bacterium CG_4_9_14_3_um_filter_32_8]|nr:MAG: hypothetical protein CO118_02960 [Flavobacteriales bacterium CG_4_9_14_3_um_filter_32_8]